MYNFGICHTKKLMNYTNFFLYKTKRTKALSNSMYKEVLIIISRTVILSLINHFKQNTYKQAGFRDYF